MSPQDSEQRLLLVSANEGVRNDLERALAGWMGNSHLSWVTQPELAASRAIELMPRIILVDDGLGANPERYVRQLRDCCPVSAVVALVAPERVDLANRMVLSGARAVLQKPLQAGELQETLSALVVERPTKSDGYAGSPRQGRVVTVMGPEGGAGRTTTAVNLAVCLQRATGQLVSLVDADFESPSIDVMLNIMDRRTMAELWDRSGGLDADLLAGVLNRHASGVDVLLAPAGGDGSRDLTTARVEELLVLMKELFAWTIIDLGHPRDASSWALADGADSILLVLPPDMVALRNARSMLDQMHTRGYNPAKTWGVVARSTARHAIPTRDIESRLIPVQHTIPDDPAVALASINRGVPVSMRHRRSALTHAYEELAGKLIKQCAVTADADRDTGVQKPRSGSRFGRHK